MMQCTQIVITNAPIDVYDRLAGLPSDVGSNVRRTCASQTDNHHGVDARLEYAITDKPCDLHHLPLGGPMRCELELDINKKNGIPLAI